MSSFTKYQIKNPFALSLLALILPGCEPSATKDSVNVEPKTESKPETRTVITYSFLQHQGSPPERPLWPDSSGKPDEPQCKEPEYNDKSEPIVMAGPKAPRTSRLRESAKEMDKDSTDPQPFPAEPQKQRDAPGYKKQLDMAKEYQAKAEQRTKENNPAPAKSESEEVNDKSADASGPPGSSTKKAKAEQKPLSTKGANQPSTHSALEEAIRPFIKLGSVAFVRPARGEMSIDECSVLINGVNTTFDDLLENARQMANSQAIPVIAIYNPTQGLTLDLLNANQSLSDTLAAADYECVTIIARVLHVLLTTESTHQGRRRVAAHSEGTILLRYALHELYRWHYSDLSQAAFQKFIDQRFAIQHYGAPVKGVTPNSEARIIPGDPVTIAEGFDQTNPTGAASIPNQIDSDSPLPTPGLQRHALSEYAARMAQFEAESIIQTAKGDGRAVARRFAGSVKSGNIRHEVAAYVLEQILVKLRNERRMLSDFQSELTAISKDGWIGGFEIPRELRTL